MVVLFYGGNLIARRELTPEGLITFLIYLVFVIPNARNLALQLARWRHLRVALERLDETAATPTQDDEKSGRELKEPVRGAIEFSDVSYRYTDRESVMDQVSFRIAPGERVAVVGESGTGKSTLFNLLLRFYDAQSGSVQIDGTDIRSIKLASLRHAIALVPQDTVLFDDTIAENVRYGRPNATDAEIRTACAAAQIAEFIESLPAGYRTMVGARGLKLSGGQRQRLALARALLKSAPILLLDEATSSVDAQTERQLRDAMDKAMEGRTTIVIAHRLATVIHLPRILMLCDGRILDDGSHDELMERCPSYRALVQTQLHEA
jgi:ATP-binding cassette, subfamily B, bacterial